VSRIVQTTTPTTTATSPSQQTPPQPPPLTSEERELSMILEDKITTVWVGKICPGVGDDAIKKLLEVINNNVNFECERKFLSLFPDVVVLCIRIQ
jgi:hypothetical protein